MNNNMVTPTKEQRVIVDNSLIEYAFFDYKKPIVICFNPAGMLLTSKQVENGEHAWCYQFLRKQQINVVAINTIDENHWFVRPKLSDYLKELAFSLQQFPERLGYGASMGAYAISCFSETLNINRALIFSPLLPPLSNKDQTFKELESTLFTLIYDPFNAEDKEIALRYPSQTHYLHFYGVGHQVIESISNIHYLKLLFLSFYNNELDIVAFYRKQQDKRKLLRYYSYMDRNPTRKNTLRRRFIIKKHKALYMIKNSDKVIKKLKHKLLKSLKKKTRKHIK
ncbi:hypothetical protein R3X26_07235 [Vibrio sp. TH_r3]|uniref:hypothetical protein n=1 Tax=Vibrio sp. TH_r3 TaxID=3082084 RepID=UPI0029559F5F|nr:hypothetical protein [Vibrio sp. TH_r3]MDV7104198.1 hypothetical protein [Vibrio sp. TH_r3]